MKNESMRLIMTAVYCSRFCLSWTTTGHFSALQCRQEQDMPGAPENPRIPPPKISLCPALAAFLLQRTSLTRNDHPRMVHLLPVGALCPVLPAAFPNHPRHSSASAGYTACVASRAPTLSSCSPSIGVVQLCTASRKYFALAANARKSHGHQCLESRQLHYDNRNAKKESALQQ